MERPESVVAAVARILPEAFPGAEILDRDLAIGSDRRVPLLIADAAGRLVLALALEETDDAALLLVLDTLAFARQHSTLLRRHVELRVDPELEPVVWVLTRSIGTEFLSRLRVTQAPSLRLMHLISFESKRGVKTYVHEVPLHGGASAGSAVALFADLPSERRELANLLVRRIERVDEELESVRNGPALEWRLRDEAVCAVQVRGDALESRIPEEPEVLAITSQAQVERFLERVVQRYLSLVRARPFGVALEALRNTAEPLLTPEELAAFDPAK